MLRLVTFHFSIHHASVEKICNPSGQEQEALNSSSIFSCEVRASPLTPGYQECLFLQVFYLTHAYGIETLLGYAPRLFDLMRFAHFGSDTEQLDDVQEAFQYLVILWIKSYFLFMTGKYARMSSSQIPTDLHSKKKRVQKRLDFSVEEGKPPTFSLSKHIPSYEGVGSKRKFSLPFIFLQAGSTLLPTLVTGREET